MGKLRQTFGTMVGDPGLQAVVEARDGLRRHDGRAAGADGPRVVQAREAADGQRPRRLHDRHVEPTLELSANNVFFSFSFVFSRACA